MMSQVTEDLEFLGVNGWVTVMRGNAGPTNSGRKPVWNRLPSIGRVG